MTQQTLRQFATFAMKYITNHHCDDDVTDSEQLLRAFQQEMKEQGIQIGSPRRLRRPRRVPADEDRCTAATKAETRCRNAKVHGDLCHIHDAWGQRKGTGPVHKQGDAEVDISVAPHKEVLENVHGDVHEEVCKQDAQDDDAGGHEDAHVPEAMSVISVLVNDVIQAVVTPPKTPQPNGEDVPAVVAQRRTPHRCRGKNKTGQRCKKRPRSSEEMCQSHTRPYKILRYIGHHNKE